MNRSNNNTTRLYPLIFTAFVLAPVVTVLVFSVPGTVYTVFGIHILANFVSWTLYYGGSDKGETFCNRMIAVNSWIAALGVLAFLITSLLSAMT